MMFLINISLVVYCEIKINALYLQSKYEMMFPICLEKLFERLLRNRPIPGFPITHEINTHLIGRR